MLHSLCFITDRSARYYLKYLLNNWKTFLLICSKGLSFISLNFNEFIPLVHKQFTLYKVQEKAMECKKIKKAWESVHLK